MSVLTRYLCRSVLERFAASIIALWAFALLFDLLDVSEELMDGGVGAFARYVALRTPTLIAEVLPIAAVLGALFTFTELIRNSELPVIWAAGVSPGLIVRRLWPICLLLIAFKLVNDDVLVPRSVAALRSWGIGDFAPGGPGLDRGRLWLRQGDAIVRLPVLGDGVANGFLALRLGKDGNLKERVEAERARLEGGDWRLDGVVRQVGGGRIEREARAAWPNEVPRRRLALLARPPQELGIADLIALIRADGYGVTATGTWTTALVHRLAGAFLPAFLVLFVAGLATRFRRGGTGALFAKGLAAAFLCIIASGVAVAFAEAGLVPPYLGPILPVLTLGLLVVLLPRRARRLRA